MARLVLCDSLYNQVCFHSQQAAEKMLKSLIISRGVFPPKTHKLADLLGLLSCDVPDDIRSRLLLLDRYYIPTRYPDATPGSLPDGMPDKADAEEALSSAIALNVWVLDLSSD